MNFVKTNNEALWDHDNDGVVAISRDGLEVATGAKRKPEGNQVWYPIVRALPEDMIAGHPQMLGPSTFERDETYDPDVVIEVYNEADFSPGAFKRYAEDRARDNAKQSLASTDWMVIRSVETGTPVPKKIASARAELRKAVDKDLETIQGLSPVEYIEYSPTHVMDAKMYLEKVVTESK